jgi:hypothetical protein
MLYQLLAVRAPFACFTPARISAVYLHCAVPCWSLKDKKERKKRGGEEEKGCNF